MNDFSDDATTSFYLVDENDKTRKRRNDEGRILKRRNDEGRNFEDRRKRPRLSGSGSYNLLKFLIFQCFQLLSWIFFFIFYVSILCLLLTLNPSGTYSRSVALMLIYCQLTVNFSNKSLFMIFSLKMLNDSLSLVNVIIVTLLTMSA
jgi:hypothetical protein